MSICLRRREFTATLGGAAVAWLFPARGARSAMASDHRIPGLDDSTLLIKAQQNLIPWVLSQGALKGRRPWWALA
jgi:hypothetical protein